MAHNSNTQFSSLFRQHILKLHPSMPLLHTSHTCALCDAPSTSGVCAFTSQQDSKALTCEPVCVYAVYSVINLNTNPPTPDPRVDYLPGVRAVRSVVRFNGVCHWASLRDSATYVYGAAFPWGHGVSSLGVGIGKGGGRERGSARWMTFTEAEIVRGSNILVPNVYWGVDFGGVCLGRLV